METRQARLRTAARTGTPIRLKDPSLVGAFRLVLGPATQRSVALHCRVQPGSTRTLSSHGHYLRHSAARRLNPANQRGKPVTELKLQPKSRWEQSIAAWLTGPEVIPTASTQLE